jgi:hypothetical protein
VPEVKKRVDVHVSGKLRTRYERRIDKIGLRPAVALQRILSVRCGLRWVIGQADAASIVVKADDRGTTLRYAVGASGNGISAAGSKETSEQDYDVRCDRMLLQHLVVHLRLRLEVVRREAVPSSEPVRCQAVARHNERAVVRVVDIIVNTRKDRRIVLSPSSGYNVDASTGNRDTVLKCGVRTLPKDDWFWQVRKTAQLRLSVSICATGSVLRE